MNNIIHKLPIDEYHADKSAIGSSGLKEILDCPALYYGQNLDPTRPKKDVQESAAQVFGNLAHCVLFEYSDFHNRYRVGPEVSSKNTKVWQEFKKECEAEGAVAIDSFQMASAKRIRESALEIPDLREALEHPGSLGEVSAYWNDPHTGVRCKCRPDLLMPVGDGAGVMFDGKTFATGDAHEFARQVPRMGYHLQNAWYRDGFETAAGIQVLEFIFIVIGNEWPHPISLVALDEQGVSVGRSMYRRALDIYAECMSTGKWPGYQSGIQTISLPKWAQE